ncbi:MAG TPA: hypothetical protein PK765_00095 [bacterium]|nr:hypothetical protein [bacterium]
MLRKNLDTLAYEGICRKIRTLLDREISAFLAHAGIESDERDIMLRSDGRILLSLSQERIVPLPKLIEVLAHASLTDQDWRILSRLGVARAREYAAECTSLDEFIFQTA